LAGQTAFTGGIAMKRILLPTATVALVAFGACLLIGRQECIAISNPVALTDDPEATNSAPDFDLNATVLPGRASNELAQKDPTVPFENPARASTKRTIKVPRTKTVTVYEDQIVEVAEGTALQQQYSVLMLKRAQRMSEEELTKAIEELESELKEQDDAADAELQKAVEILNQLQENFSGTPAARRAEAAIPVLQGTKAPPATAEGESFYNPNEVQFQPPLNPLPTF
jgi:hypothetical protein